MSLRGFHLFFIILSILMCAGCATWAFANQVAGPFGIGCVVTGVALVFYGISFVRKSRKLVL